MSKRQQSDSPVTSVIPRSFCLTFFAHARHSTMMSTKPSIRGTSLLILVVCVSLPVWFGSMATATEADSGGECISDVVFREIMQLVIVVVVRDCRVRIHRWSLRKTETNRLDCCTMLRSIHPSSHNVLTVFTIQSIQ